MRNFFGALLCFLLANVCQAQTPIAMGMQPGLSYTENFTDITNWTANFAAGIGASAFGSVAVLATGTILGATKTTTSSATFSTGSSGGVQKGSGNILLLTTGATDNTSSLALDFLMDFTGVNAGTLSFDWASVNNSTGDRKGSLKVYATTDNITFTEIMTAAVTNFTNNTLTSGSITSIALPASFNNSATARLRFYYHNGVGGTTGSRPKISIDNLNVTAISGACVAPAAQPTTLSFNAVTDVSLAGSFSASSPAANAYIVVISNNSTLTSNPVDGTIYSVGDPLGDGTVLSIGNSTSFSAINLSASTQYYFFVFSVSSACTGGPKYLTTNPLIGNVTTAAGLPTCVAPATQPTNLIFGMATTNAIQGSFTATTANQYIVLNSTAATPSVMPVNGTVYSIGDVLGNSAVISSNNTTTFTATGLLPNIQYYFFIFAVNGQSCTVSPAYNITSPLTGSNNTLPLPVCKAPISQPTLLQLTATSSAITGSFTVSANTDNYLVIKSTSPSLSSLPINNTNYLVGASLGGGTVVANGFSNSFLSGGLLPVTTYYYFVFASNVNCTGGTKYNTISPLSYNATTNNAAVNNYYFGNLHTHSDYSDGNKDNPGYTPGQDYEYARNSSCMDFLGIAEHNHFSSTNNPGNIITNFHQGFVQADAYNTTHPSFLALYGMEWGVISGGGHVLVYADAANKLYGWETGVGGVSGNNYDTYVAKNDYTGASGVFKTINDDVAFNTFAMLAHPNTADYNNLAASYNIVADNAIVGTAVESGPAFSTNTTYTEPSASPFSFLSYYNKLLAAGYHVGPSIDHDNHNTTFGRTATTRTAVISPTLTRTDVIKAFRAMNFYATHDCDIQIDFEINTKIMGSTVTAAGAPLLNVNLFDPTNGTTTAVTKVMYGKPGTNVNAVQVYSATGSSFTWSDVGLANLTTGYYYLDITNAGSRAITAPIWYNRNDAVLPIKLQYFTAQKNALGAKLNWASATELNAKNYEVEKSTDGMHWKTMVTINANGNSNATNEYYAFDNFPTIGVNYYRLKQVDVNGKFEYSVVRTVMFATETAITIFPNPASGTINLYVKNKTNKTFTVSLMDISGRVVYTSSSKEYKLAINAKNLIKGIYFVKVIAEGNVYSEKVIVE